MNKNKQPHHYNHQIEGKILTNNSLEKDICKARNKMKMNRSTEREEIYSPQDDIISEYRLFEDKKDSPEKIVPDFKMLITQNRSTYDVKYENVLNLSSDSSDSEDE